MSDSRWQTDGSEQLSFFEKVTQQPGRALLDLSGLASLIKSGKHLEVYDMCSDTGCIASLIFANPAAKNADILLTSGDIMPAKLEQLTKKGETAGWTKSKVGQIDATDTKFADETFDLITGNMAVKFPLRGPIAVVQECHRVLKTGGKLAISTWSQYAWFKLLMHAHKNVAGLPPIGDMGIQGDQDWHAAQWTTAKLEELGFKNVRTENFEFDHRNENAHIFVSSFQLLVRLLCRQWTEEQLKTDFPRFMNELERLIALEAGGPDKPWSMHMGALITVAEKA